MTEGKDRNAILAGSMDVPGGEDVLPPHEAMRLRALVTGRSILEVRAGVHLTMEQKKSFQDLAIRRLRGEPLQYIEGSVPFAGVEVVVDGRALIPRPETEYLVELAVASTVRPSLIVDLCCGSGALALALKRRFPSARVLGTDVSAAALELAGENARRNRLDVEWSVGDLFGALPAETREKIDLLVANPPYVASSDWDNLPADVRQEPPIALLAGDRGTEVIEAILGDLANWISPVGKAWIEVGDGQAGILARSYAVTAIDDQYGVPRYLRVEGPGST